MNYRYSIIIPVYNVEKYLEECVLSITNQTYKNYEIILVDDGSTDNSGKMCDALAKINNNIKVIHQENGGLSEARNTGISCSTGDFIVFLDSDDYWIDSNNLNIINDKINKENADILMFNVTKFYDGEKVFISNKKSKEFSSIYSLIKFNLYKACATNKVIKKEIIEFNKLRFTKGLLSEDIEWCGNLLKYDYKIVHLNDYVYAYRQRKGSITHSKNKKHVIDILNQCEYALNDNYENEKNKELVLSFYAYEFCTALGFFSINFNNDKNIEKQIFDNFDILDYCISDKVKLIKFLFKFFNKKIAFFVIKIFMSTK